MSIIRFGTRGWRARYDDGFNEESVARIADGVATIWQEAKPHSRVLVGDDTRFASREMAMLAAEVMAAKGLRVYLSDRICPTPALGWSISKDPDAVGGLMITASEAPADYGGVLLLMRDGSPATRIFKDELEATMPPSAPEGRGSYETINLMDDYLCHILSYVDKDLICNAHLKVMVDPMYGAGEGYLARILRDIGCDVTEIHGGLHDDFAGIHPDPMEPWVDDCEAGTVSSKADMGLVLDGDADRLSVVDEKGNLLTPKTMIPLLMDHLVTDRKRNGKVLATISCSSAIKTQAKRLGIPLTETLVGFNRLYAEMWDAQVMLATEEYGGVCIPSHFPERDGLLAALLMVEYRAMRNEPISQLEEELERAIGHYDYGRRDIRMDYGSIDSFRLMLPGLNPSSLAGKKPKSVSHGDGLKLTFSDGSWTMIRASETEPMVRIYAEASNSVERMKLMKAAIQLVRSSSL